MTWAILASGPSMSQEVADYVRGKCKVLVVSNVYKLAPWADVLVSNDRKWWEQYPEAFDFQGKKFCSQPLRGVEQFTGHIPKGRNSGLMGMFVARKLGARRLLLCGFDMHGTHFFGPHPEPLRNSTERIFRSHIGQFNGFSGCDVINCTPGSRLTQFSIKELKDVLP